MKHVKSIDIIMLFSITMILVGSYIVYGKDGIGFAIMTLGILGVMIGPAYLLITRN